MNGSARTVARGMVLGYVASRTMDAATSWFYGRQTEASKRREEEIAPGGTLVKIGRDVGALVGLDLAPSQAGRIGLVLHRMLGSAYGAAGALLARRGTPPLAAGTAVGAAAFVLVDEGTAIGQLADYPLESHLRGVVGHASYGLAAGVLLAVAGGD